MNRTINVMVALWLIGFVFALCGCAGGLFGTGVGNGQVSDFEAAALNIGGGAAMFGLATKADVQELKQQVSEIKVTVDKLAIQAGVEEQIRLRSLQARSVATNAGHDRGP